MRKIHFVLIIVFGAIICTTSCTKDNSTISDAQQTAALRNVSLKYDSMGNQLGLPDGALSGKSFQQLRLEDSAKYTNPENYSIAITSNFSADNTKSNSGDAHFEGLDLNLIMDTIVSAPVKTSTGSFDVKKNSKLPVGTQTSINLKTHRVTGLYIFQQIVDGADLATTFVPSFKYKIGSINGTLPLPNIKQNIPTRASDETKAFLKGLIESGIFKVKEGVGK